MNQILQVKENKLKTKLGILKKVILFFIISIIIFGLIAVGYLIYQNINNGNIDIPGITERPKYTPTITLTQTQDNKVVLRVESKEGLSSIKYNWNNAEPEVITLSAEMVAQVQIDLPIGENILYITVTNIEGQKAEKQETFKVEGPKPIIDLSVVGSDIKITITSELELSQVIYSWNNEEPKVENMSTYVDKNNFEKQIEIPVGLNSLSIIAIDTNGTKTEKTQSIRGVTKAKTTTEVKKGYLHFTVTGKENIKTVEFEFNGQKYIMNTNTFGETKVVHYKVKLVEGMNYLKVTSTTESDGVDTTTWENEYTAE